MGFEFISNYVFIVEFTLCIHKEEKFSQMLSYM